MSCVLGEGVLSWPRAERITDRYGVVYLGIWDGRSRHELGGVATQGSVHLEESVAGQRGSLVATVLEARKSGHIGDLFYGVFPTTPEAGERITLGAGTLFFKGLEEDGETYHMVGLRPDDGREYHWLDIRALYRCHEQTVRLEFVPEGE